VQEGREVVVACYSKLLSSTERNCCTTRKELLAVIKSVKHFRPYLYGRSFRLRTDHASLVWLCKRAEPSRQVARWLEILAEFSYRIEHRPGKKHSNADGLSRRPDKGCKQCLHIERRDGGPSRSELETLCNTTESYDWEQGRLQLRTATPPEDVQNLRVNPVLADNVKELQQLQETLPGVVADVYRDVSKKRRSPSPASHQPATKQRWLSSSPRRHSCPARNLREVETRIHELEKEVLRLTPRVTAVTSELQALRSSVTTLKRGTSDWVSTPLCAGIRLSDFPDARDDVPLPSASDLSPAGGVSHNPSRPTVCPKQKLYILSCYIIFFINTQGCVPLFFYKFSEVLFLDYSCVVTDVCFLFFLFFFFYTPHFGWFIRKWAFCWWGRCNGAWDLRHAVSLSNQIIFYYSCK